MSRSLLFGALRLAPSMPTGEVSYPPVCPLYVPWLSPDGTFWTFYNPAKRHHRNSAKPP